MAMPRARGGRLVTDRPLILISPWLGVSRPAISRSSVVFPQPDAPRSTRNSRSATSRSTACRAVTAPKRLAIARIAMSAMASPRNASAVGDAPERKQIFPDREQKDQCGQNQHHPAGEAERRRRIVQALNKKRGERSVLN